MMFDFTRENTRRWQRDRIHRCLLDIYALGEERKEGVEETRDDRARDGKEERKQRSGIKNSSPVKK